MSLRDTILAADDIETEDVPVPEWGVNIQVRGMSGSDRADIMDAALQDDGSLSLKRFYPDVVILASHDPETGERIFDPADRDALMAKSGKALDRLAEVALELSGMTEESRKEAGKDSPSTTETDASTS